jgi:hypothetical protein
MEAPLAQSPVGGSPSPRRLEDYDDLRAKMNELTADKARLDWLDAEAVRTYPVAALVVKKGHDRDSSEWVNSTGTAREAIDRAIEQVTALPNA